MRTPASSPYSRNVADGLLLVDKPAGPTSHDIVAQLRRHLQFKKIGHGGTLDPMATGLLVLLLGRGTKLSSLVMGSDKTYDATFYFGITTDTQDAEGRILEQKEVDGLSKDAILAELTKWMGDVMQTPPMVSAIKHNGIPLYKLARKGKSVKREPRLIHVYSFDLLDFEPPEARVRIACTKGTYVRTLAADIGDALNCGAHLSVLRRTRSGPFSVDDALPHHALLAMDHEELMRRIIPAAKVKTMAPEYP